MIISGMTQADMMYTCGPETDVARARIVCVGRVSGYKKTITDGTDSRGDMPSHWTVTGEVVDSECLKGGPLDSPLRIERQERSFMLPPPESRIFWELPYGDLTPDGNVVVFLSGDDEQPQLRAVPSGVGEFDLAGLVKDIVRNESEKVPGKRFEMWQAYLEESATVAGRKTALRAMCVLAEEWTKLMPVLAELLSDASMPVSVRAYAFVTVAYHVVKETWGEKGYDVVKFLTSRFSAEKEPDLVLQYLFSLDFIADYCSEEEFRPQRRPILSLIEQTLRSRPSLSAPGGPAADPEDEEYYRETCADILAGPNAPIPDEEP